MTTGPSIRAFLLDLLSSEERDRFEAELFDDRAARGDGLLDLVQEEEDALLDEFLLEELPATERLSLEKRLACSEQLQDRLRLRKLFLSTVRRVPAEAKSPGRSSRGLFVLRLVACGSLAASLVFAVLWFQARRNLEDLRSQVASAIVPAPLRPPVSAGEGQAPSPIFIPALITRGPQAGPEFTLSEGQPVTEIQVQLSHHPNASDKIDVVLRREDVPVLQISQVKPRSIQSVDYVSVYIDTQDLDAGTYEISTIWNADQTDRRSFRIGAPDAHRTAGHAPAAASH